MQAVELIEKDKKKGTAKTTGDENNDDSSVEEVSGPSSSKKRKVSTKDNKEIPTKLSNKKICCN